MLKDSRSLTISSRQQSAKRSRKGRRLACSWLLSIVSSSFIVALLTITTLLAFDADGSVGATRNLSYGELTGRKLTNFSDVKEYDSNQGRKEMGVPRRYRENGKRVEREEESNEIVLRAREKEKKHSGSVNAESEVLAVDKEESALMQGGRNWGRRNAEEDEAEDEVRSGELEIPYLDDEDEKEDKFSNIKNVNQKVEGLSNAYLDAEPIENSKHSKKLNHETTKIPGTTALEDGKLEGKRMMGGREKLFTFARKEPPSGEKVELFNSTVVMEKKAAKEQIRTQDEEASEGMLSRTDQLRLTAGKGLVANDYDKEYRNLSSFVITDENFEQIVQAESNENMEVILTTFSIYVINDTLQDDFEYGMTAFNTNWAWHLERVGVKRFLLVGMDEDSCVPSRKQGLKCYVNALDWLEDEQIIRGRQVAIKWLYLQKMVELGFHPIFLDNDAVVLKNPFKVWNRSIDIQGLSDARPVNGILPELAMDFHCGVGKSYGGQHYPCVSTGVMFIRSTVTSKAFLDAMIETIDEDEGTSWEQAIFQRLIIPFLMQVGDGMRPLTLRILPVESFHNVGLLHIRKAASLPLSSAIVHCGFIYGQYHKRRSLKRLHLWHEFIPLNDST